ncbi:MAG: hypothetical protein WCR29_06840 [Bacteroidales bacterium]
MKMNKLRLVTEQLEKYLNLAQELTNDYYLTMKLGEDPMEIISRKNEKLKRIEAMIYVCKDKLRFIDHEITYGGSGIRVEIL